MDKIASRIKELIKKQGISNGDFARKVGLNPSIVSHILSGRNKVSLQVILQIKEAFPEVDLEYLLTGSIAHDRTSSSTLSKPNKHVQQAIHVETKAEKQASTPLSDIPLAKPVQRENVKSIERVIILYSDKSMDSYLP